jgi:Ca2+-binding RTX toxin-like protein
MIHELGHGLGLGHPHDGGLEDDRTQFPGVPDTYYNPDQHSTGEHGLNQSIYTVMSYFPGLETVPATLAYGNQGGLGAFDIAALQKIYGANMSTATGDNVYVLPTQNAKGTGWSCIWDAGGIDTISGVSSTTSVVIDLNAATLISHDPRAGGYISQQSGIAGGFTIANGVVIENAIGGSGEDRLIGNAAANVLTGNDGDDTLDGKTGADTMSGGEGGDIYYVDHVGDLVIETSSGGTADEVHTVVSHTLAAYVEDLIARGSASISLTGNASNNMLLGNEGANVLNGKAGADQMYGAQGNDTYYVDNIGDKVIETSTGGTDTVVTTISHTLAAYVENLTASGTADITLTGNTLHNVIKGNGGANRIYGGAGNDVLTGGAGRDVFMFNTKPGRWTNLDTITDFSAVDDTMRLDNAIFTKLGAGTLAAPRTLNSAFFKLGAVAKDANDYILYDRATGYLRYDADGSGAGAAVVFAKLANKPALTHWDFQVV